MSADSRLAAFMQNAPQQRRNDELVMECIGKILQDIDLFCGLAKDEGIPVHAFMGVLGKHQIAIALAGFLKMGMPEDLTQLLYKDCLRQAKGYVSE